MVDKKHLPKVFGKVLKNLRGQNKLSQEKFADRAGLTDRSHVSALERGQRSPNINTLFSLAKALEIPAHKLIEAVEHELDKNNR